MVTVYVLADDVVNIVFHINEISTNPNPSNIAYSVLNAIA